MRPGGSRAPRDAGVGRPHLTAARSAAALLVFDITDVDSFTRVKSWVKELRQMAGAPHAPRVSRAGLTVPPPQART